MLYSTIRYNIIQLRERKGERKGEGERERERKPRREVMKGREEVVM